MAQLGVEESDVVLAQIAEELGDETLAQLAADPEVYENLAQIANEYNVEELAQSDAESDSEADSNSESASESASESGSESGASSSADSNSGSESGSDSDSASESGSDSASNSGSESDCNCKAQIAAESDSDSDADSDAQIDNDDEMEFAQLLAEEELATNMETLQEFLAQIGVNDTDSLLAQLGETLSPEQIGSLANNPNTYDKLAQVAEDYFEDDTTLAQTYAEFDDEMADDYLF